MGGGGSGRGGQVGGEGSGRGGGSLVGGCQVRCERRIEVFVKIKKKKTFLGGGVGGGGVWLGGGSGWL